jgi:hypothetical protein
MYYVALSRLQKLSSVFLLKFDNSHIKVSDAVVEEMDRLRTMAQITISVPLLYKFPENNIK